MPFSCDGGIVITALCSLRADCSSPFLSSPGGSETCLLPFLCLSLACCLVLCFQLLQALVQADFDATVGLDG